MWYNSTPLLLNNVQNLSVIDIPFNPLFLLQPINYSSHFLILPQYQSQCYWTIFSLLYILYRLFTIPHLPLHRPHLLHNHHQYDSGPSHNRHLHRYHYKNCYHANYNNCFLSHYCVILNLIQ